MRIDDEFRDLIPPPTDEERAQLIINVTRDGVQSPFIVWDEEDILLDGHTRHQICLDNEIEFPAPVRMSFKSRGDAKAWVIRNQFGRRNLTVYQRSELALKLEPLIKVKAKEKQREGGRNKVVQNSAQPESSSKTRDEVAAIAGVSHDTIAKVKVIEERATPEQKEKLRRGEESINAVHKKLTGKKQKASKPESAAPQWRVEDDVQKFLELRDKLSGNWTTDLARNVMRQIFTQLAKEV